MGVADENVTGERAVALPFIDGSVEGREGGLPDPRRVRSGDGGNKTVFLIFFKAVIFSTGVRPKDGKVEGGDLKESRHTVDGEEVRMGVSGARRALRKR